MSQIIKKSAKLLLLSIMAAVLAPMYALSASEESSDSLVQQTPAADASQVILDEAMSQEIRALLLDAGSAKTVSFDYAKLPVNADDFDKLIFRVQGQDTVVINPIFSPLRSNWATISQAAKSEASKAIDGHEFNLEPVFWLSLTKFELSENLPAIHLQSEGEDKVRFHVDDLSANWDIEINTWNPFTLLPMSVKTGSMSTAIDITGLITLERDKDKGYLLDLVEIEPKVKTDSKGSITWTVVFPNPITFWPFISVDFELKRTTLIANTKIDEFLEKEIRNKLDGMAELKKPIRLDDPRLFSPALYDAFLIPIYSDLMMSNAISYSLDSTADGIPIVEIALENPIVGPWYPNKNLHPRILYGPSDRGKMQARINTALYKEWYVLIKNEAKKEPVFTVPGPDGILSEDQWKQEVINAQIARSAALVYDLEGDKAGKHRALNMLFRVHSQMGDPAFTSEWAQKSLYSAEVLLLMSQTYDLLLGQGFPSNISREEITKNQIGLSPLQYVMVYSTLLLSGLEAAQQRIGAIAESRLGQLQELTYLHTHMWLLVPNQNHTIRNAAALGTSALVLNDKTNAYEYISLAMGAIWRALGTGAGGQFADPTLFTKEMEYGGFAEGPAYLDYSAELYLPFMLAYQRFIEGEPQDQIFTYTNWLSQYDVMVPEMLSSERVRRIHEWNLRMSMPNGQRPNIKDADIGTTFYSGLLANDLSSEPLEMRKAWAADFATGGFNTRDRLVDHFVFYDDSLYDPSVNPGSVFESPTYANAEEGNVVMRSDWSSDALYLHLLADHNWDRSLSPNAVGGTRYPAHQQADNTSFLIYGYEDYLAIDSGYGGFDLRDTVKNATNHNVVLVDGKGPTEDTEAFILGTSQSNLVEAATVTASYQDTTVTRQVLFVNNQYFVVVDDLQSNSHTPHRYDWQLHGNNKLGEVGSFQKHQGGFLWRTEKGKELLVHVTNTSEGGVDEVIEHPGYHFVAHGQEYLREHTVIEARENAATNIKFIATLLPSDGGATPRPSVTSYQEPGVFAGLGVSYSAYTDLIVVRDPVNNISGTYEIAGSITGIPTIKTNADLLILRILTTNGLVVGIYGTNMSFLQVDGKNIVDSPLCSVSLAGDWTVGTSCTVVNSASVEGDLIVATGAVLTIAPGAHLDIDFANHNLRIKPGGKVLIKPGGKIE